MNRVLVLRRLELDHLVVQGHHTWQDLLRLQSAHVVLRNQLRLRRVDVDDLLALSWVLLLLLHALQHG